MKNYSAEDALLLMRCLNLALPLNEEAVLRREYSKAHEKRKKMRWASGREYNEDNVFIETTKEIYSRIIPLSVHSGIASIMAMQRPKKFDYEIGRRGIIKKLAKNMSLDQIAKECRVRKEDDL